MMSYLDRRNKQDDLLLPPTDEQVKEFENQFKEKINNLVIA